MKQLFLIFIFSSLTRLYAASCCAGGGGSTQVITAQNRAEMRLSLSHSQVVAEKFQSPKVLFWDTQREQYTSTLSPSYGQKISENWQVGVRTEVLTKDYRFVEGQEQSKTRLGDSFLLLAYEAVEMSSILDWRPQVFLSFETTFPTGRGLYESQESSLVDVTGAGRWENRIGATFVKFRSGYKLNASFSYLYSHAQSLDEFRLESRDSYALELGASTHHPRKKIVWGLNLRANRKEGFVVLKDSLTQYVPKEQYFDFSPYVSYLFGTNSLVTLTYTDQTIFGPVYHTTLARSLSLNLMRFLPL